MSTIVLTDNTAEFLAQPAPSAAPALPAAQPWGRNVAAPASARRRTARRPRRLDWEAIAVILLMLSCAAVGLYRLFWMGQI